MAQKEKKTTPRKSGNDWRTTHENAVARVTKIENEIKKRLKFLIKEHPDAELGVNDYAIGGIKKANSLDKHYVKGMGVNSALQYINVIEKYLADLHPHQQGDLFPVHKTSENAVRIANPETKDKRHHEPLPDFIEYHNEGDEYVHPERKIENEILEIRLYCEHENCDTYIKGKEGYNGAFEAETGQCCDLRNQGFMCKKHSVTI